MVLVDAIARRLPGRARRGLRRARELLRRARRRPRVPALHAPGGVPRLAGPGRPALRRPRRASPRGGASRAARDRAGGHVVRNPVDRLAARLRTPWRVAVDWIVTRRRGRASCSREGVGDQPVPDPVVLDGADPALRATEPGCEGGASPTACSRTGSSTASTSRSAATSSSSSRRRAASECARSAGHVRQAARRPARARRGGWRTASSTSTASGWSSRTSQPDAARRGHRPAAARCRRAATSCSATTASSRATRARGARCRATNLIGKVIADLLAAAADLACS